MTDNGGPSIAELGRQVREALGRLEALAIRIDQNFVSNRVLELSEKNIDLAQKALRSEVEAVSRELAGKATQLELAELRARVTSLEDDRKWMQRLVFGLVIAAVIGLVLTVPGSLAK